MNDYLKMADVFNDKFDASMLKVNPECVNENYDDGVTPHDHIAYAVKMHDALIKNIDSAGAALIDAIKDMDKLKKEIEFLSKRVSDLEQEKEDMEGYIMELTERME